MKRVFTAAVLISALVAFAQNKPILLTNVPSRSSSSSSSSSATVDAGVKSDAGMPERVPSQATMVDVDRVRKEVSELRAKVNELEARLAKTEARERDVTQLKDQLAKLADRLDDVEARRDSEEKEVVRKKTTTAQTTNLLGGALQQLTQTGNVANVDAWLRQAEGNTSGSQQKLIQLARQSLSQQDLVATRQYISLAMNEPAN